MSLSRHAIFRWFRNPLLCTALALSVVGGCHKPPPPHVDPVPSPSAGLARAAEQLERGWVMELGTAGPLRGEQLVPLLDAFDSPIWENRYVAARTLRRMIPRLAAPTDEVMQALVARLGDPAAVVGAEARMGLLACGTPAVPKLVPLLELEGVPREYALITLGGLGEPARVALPRIERLLTHERADVRAAAWFALHAMGDAATIARHVPAAAAHLQETGQHRHLRMQWLGLLTVAMKQGGEGASAARAAVERATHDPDLPLQRAAREALGLPFEATAILATTDTLTTTVKS